MRRTDSIRAVVNGDERFHVKACRAEDLLDSLPDSCVSLIVTDPPYFKVKADEWDRAWKKPEEFLRWIGGIFDRFRRVLAPNGSMYVFASPQMAWNVEGEVRQRFDVLNAVTWGKAAGWSEKARKEDLRCFFGNSERVIFAEHVGADSSHLDAHGYDAECGRLREEIFRPLRQWMLTALTTGPGSRRLLNEAIGSSSSGGGMASHYFGETGQFELPTRTVYDRISDMWPRAFDRCYADVRSEYNRLHEEFEARCAEVEHIRRPFTVSSSVPYTDVWTYPTVQSYDGKHGCEKPWQMGLDIVNASSRPDDLVLDCFAGSGCFPAAAVALGRRAIACDMSAEWADVTRDRCRRAIDNPDSASTNRRAAIDQRVAADRIAS
jgi:site-specific DNA-methyltransferase (adenine-specific)